MATRNLKAARQRELGQPWRGLFILVVSLLVAFGIASIWTPDRLQGLPFGFALCLVPVFIVMALFWKGWPAEKYEQPVRGFIVLILALIFGSIIFMWIKVFIGKGEISPITNIFMILVVTLVVILSPLLEFWPFGGRLPRPYDGLAWLIALFVIGFILFRTLFNFGPFSAEAWYSSRMDPGGRYFAQGPLSVVVMGLPFAYAFLHLQCWPFSRFKQPWRGLTTAVIVWSMAGLMYYITTSVLGFGLLEAQVKFGVYGVFGMIIWIMMFETWPGSSLPQPGSGIIKITAGILLGIGMFYVVRAFGQWAFPASPALQGDGLYQWMATVALGLCFPFFALYTAMFQSWPLPLPTSENT